MFTGLLLSAETSSDPKYRHRAKVACPITNDPKRAGYSVVEVQVDDAAWPAWLQAAGHSLVTVNCTVDQRQFGKTTVTNFIATGLQRVGNFTDYVAQPDGKFIKR